jgi:hypothetical protein
MKIDSKQGYRYYLALRLHFTTDTYDITKFKGRIKFNEQAFEQKRERFIFSKLTSKYTQEELINFLVANFITGEKYGGIYDLPKAEKVYLDYTKVHQSLQYLFLEDIKDLRFEVPFGKPFPEYLWHTDGTDHPVILKRYLGRKTRLETLVIFEKLYKFVDTVSEVIDDPFWAEVSRLIVKYKPFVKLAGKSEKFQTILTGGGVSA